jgi:hypothetical protein
MKSSRTLLWKLEMLVYFCYFFTLLSFLTAYLLPVLLKGPDTSTAHYLLPVLLKSPDTSTAHYQLLKWAPGDMHEKIFQDKLRKCVIRED